MDGLIELIIESVPDAQVIGLARDVARNIVVQGEDEFSTEWLRDLDAALQERTRDTSLVSTRFAKTKVGDVAISRVLLTVLHYEGGNDVSILFDSQDVEDRARPTAPAALAAWSETMARIYHAGDYYCGYEPASDRATRVFTRKTLGPLRI